MRALIGLVGLAVVAGAFCAAGCGGDAPRGAVPVPGGGGGAGTGPAGGAAAGGQPTAALAGPDGLKLSGPYTHENLSVFLIHGDDKIDGRAILTLNEAMTQKTVVVHETGNVQELSIENTSGTKTIFVQSGDIVKGGKQDRVIAFDFIVPPKSGKMKISSFCVEQGRWSGRGAEAVAQFSASEKQVASKDLKLAAKLRTNQSEVWNEVAKSQDKLSANVGGSVRSAQSGSSMQLSLEDEKVAALLAEYRKALEKIVEGKTDVVGFAFAINGKVNSADVYACTALFGKLWPKLLESAATEAVAEFKKGLEFKAVRAEDVTACMADAGKGRAQPREVSGRVRMITRETEANYGFETVDKESGAVLHRNCVAK